MNSKTRVFRSAEERSRGEVAESMLAASEGVLRDHGMPEDEARVVSASVVGAALAALGGQQVYFPYNYNRYLRNRERAMLDAWDGKGSTLRALSRQWGVSLRSVYRILKRAQERKEVSA